MSEYVDVSPRKQPRQARSRATVEAILEATARVLQEEGGERATTNRIAEVAGVSIGTLYQYFPNREALVLEVAHRHSSEMVEMLAVMAVDLADAPIHEAVRTYVRAMLQAHAIEPELHRALIAQVMQIGLEHFTELSEMAIAIVATYLEERAHQILPTNIPVAAFVLVSTVESVTHIAACDRPKELASGELEDEVVAFILRYLGVDEGMDGAPPC